MASGLDLTAFDAALKQHYTDDRVEDMVYARNPFLALVPKMENAGGRNIPIPIIHGNPQGRSKTFSNAQTRAEATSTLVKDFLLTRVKDYSLATVDGETLEASKGDANAFISAATTEMDGAINSLTRSLAIGLYRGSSAALGQVSAEPTENAGDFTITLKDAEDVTNFEVNQMIVIYSAESGGSIRTSDGSDDEWVIESIDRSAGTITLTGTYDASGTIAADDYLFVEGDRGLGISGLASWLPSAAPSGGESFFGVDRSVDRTRLAGLSYDASSAPIEEALIEGASKVGREGGYIDHYFMSYAKFSELKKALGSKVQYVDLAANARVSFRGVMVDGDDGPIKCIPDQNVQGNRIWGVCMKMWKLYSIGKAVRPVGHDGNTWLRQSSDDGVEVRYGFYGNLGCRAPGYNINIQV